MFPEARVSWIYASSEVGASIVVHDGRAGFPVEWLERERPTVPGSPSTTANWSSPRRTTARARGRRAHGRAVVVDDGRVLITGRTSADEINVGGSKVSAGVVRSVLQSHPDVVWARVRGRKAPLVGRMVVAEVVLRSGRPPRRTPSPRSAGGAESGCRTTAYRAGSSSWTRSPQKETLKSDV